MKNLMQQPIYKFFISAIDKIKEKFGRGDNGLEDNARAILLLDILQDKIELLDYEPFPHYQTIIQLLSIREELDTLCRNMFLLFDDNSQENIKPLIMQSLDQLKAFAHFLNFLECKYTSKALEKKHFKTILSNTAVQVGVIFEEIRRDSDCHGKNYVNIKEKQEEPLANPSEIELEDYDKIIDVYIRFIGSEEVQASTNAREFAVLLFNDLIEIDKDSSTMSRLVGNESNLFFLGEIEAVVKLINEYKNEFQQQIAPSEEASSSSPVLQIRSLSL